MVKQAEEEAAVMRQEWSWMELWGGTASAHFAAATSRIRRLYRTSEFGPETKGPPCTHFSMIRKPLVGATLDSTPTGRLTVASGSVRIILSIGG